MRAMCNAYFGLFMDMLRIFLEKNTTLQEKMVCLAENMALVQKKEITLQTLLGLWSTH